MSRLTQHIAERANVLLKKGHLAYTYGGQMTDFRPESTKTIL